MVRGGETMVWMTVVADCSCHLWTSNGQKPLTFSWVSAKSKFTGDNSFGIQIPIGKNRITCVSRESVRG